MATTFPGNNAPVSQQSGWYTRLKEIRKTYAFRVILQGILTAWAATTFTFFLVRLLPGDPISIETDRLMQQGYTADEAANIAATLFRYDPSVPVWQQYLQYMGNLLQGDLGQSIKSAGTEVNAIILRFLPWTLLSVGSALLISFTLGIIFGTAMAYWRGSTFDNVMTGIASSLSGVPDYVYAIGILLIFGVQLEWFNVGEMRGGVNPDIPVGFTFAYIGSVIKHALLPVTTYVIATVGVWMLTMKSSTISTLGEDYINVAKARGLSEQRILFAYVGRNAMLPLVTRLAISIGFVLSGSVIVERFFEYPGLGRALTIAVTGRDYTTMQGIFLVITIAIITSNILADLVLGLLDPRVSLEEK